jgi:hypothetical protein
MRLPLQNAPHELRLLAGWMNSWTGVAAVIIGMRVQGSDVEVKEFLDGWRVTFYPIGIAHSWRRARHSSRRRGALSSTPRGGRRFIGRNDVPARSGMGRRRIANQH